MEIWKAEFDIVEKVRGCIKDYHPELFHCQNEIAVLFREKAAKQGGVLIPGKARKAPTVLDLLGDREYKFIIELAADEWNKMTEAKRDALIDHLLCSCGAEEDDKTGEYKYFIRPPDFVGYLDEIKRHGIWRTAKEEDDASPVIEDATIQDLMNLGSAS